MERTSARRRPLRSWHSSRRSIRPGRRPRTTPRGPPSSMHCRRSTWTVAGGMLVLWIVIASPLAALDHALLTFHMLLRSTAARRLGRSLTHPVLCWLVGTGVVIAWHVPPALELSMRSHPWHVVQHLTFFVAGLLFWWPVINPGRGATLPRSSAPLYLFLATLPCDALSALLAFCGRVVYPSHRSAHHPLFGLSPLQDQECAGALMWFWVTIAYLLPAIVITLRMLSPSRREISAVCGNVRVRDP